MGNRCEARGGRRPAAQHAATRRPRLGCWLSLLLLALANPAAQAGSDIDVEITESFSAVPTSAADSASLREAVQHRSAGSGEAGAFEALTQVELSGTLTLEDREGGCVWSGPKYRLDLHTSLPHWSEREQADPALQVAWDRALHGLREHEAGHRRIARESVAGLLEQVRALNPEDFRDQPCQKLRNRIAAIEMQKRLQLQLAHDAYDRRTRLGATQGAVLEISDRPNCASLAYRPADACSRAASPLCVCAGTAGRRMRSP